MKTLVIDTATRACSVALFDGEDCFASEYADIGRGHAERLVPMIAGLPEKGKADRIMVNVGPGSFTGIRIGISAARALGLAWNAPVGGYGCLNLLGAMVESHEPVDVVMTGGHGEYFFQAFDGNRQAVSEPTSLTPQEAACRSTANMVVGDVANDLVLLRGAGAAQFALPDAREWFRIKCQTTLPPSAIYGRGADARPMAIPK